MDMRTSIALAEGLMDLFKKKEAAPTGPRSMTATMPSGFGIRWHKETDPAARKVIWHGRYRAGEDSTAREFVLRAELLSQKDDWRYSVEPKDWGYVVGVVAIKSVETALKGLFLMCESLRPASVGVNASGNLQKFFTDGIKKMLPQFSKIGYEVREGRLVRVR